MAWLGGEEGHSKCTGWYSVCLPVQALWAGALLWLMVPSCYFFKVQFPVTTAFCWVFFSHLHDLTQCHGYVIVLFQINIEMIFTM